MAHTRTCPHECNACPKPAKKVNGIDIEAWRAGNCASCSGEKEKERKYACTQCWSNMPWKEKAVLIETIDKHG